MAKKYNLKADHVEVLKKLQAIGQPIEARELCSQLKIEYEKLMSGAIYSLTEQGLAQYSERNINLLRLTAEGQEDLQKGLPERQVFTLFTQNGRKEAPVLEFQQECQKTLGFDQKIFFIALGQMKKKKWVVGSKATGKDSIFIYSENPPPTEEEEAIKLFSGKSQLILEDLDKKYHEAIEAIYKRKLITQEKTTLRIIQLTEIGAKLKENQIALAGEEVLAITPEMLKTGSWKENIPNLKSYEVNALAPKFGVGKYHPLTVIINEIREIFLSMGFAEIRGPIIETAFFNFDALYQPQDHPAREMHDTFYLKNPATGKLPSQDYWQAVKATHENGGECGSAGWRYNWSDQIATKSLLRTHTTATTVRQLRKVVQEKKTLPMKVFCIDRVFRNEKVDRTHLAEFQQIEGIIIGENVTLCDLIGQIVEFYKRMGFSKVVTRPGFFPYTEPSMEISVYSDQLGRWLEMGGSGIFRPEVTYPAGIKEPVRVLAWGMGLERLAMLKLQRSDIRDLYQSPISWLREVPY
jgi:phenylalanyl-tRNA synthetase alpha chain